MNEVVYFIPYWLSLSLFIYLSVCILIYLLLFFSTGPPGWIYSASFCYFFLHNKSIRSFGLKVTGPKETSTLREYYRLNLLILIRPFNYHTTLWLLLTICFHYFFIGFADFIIRFQGPWLSQHLEMLRSCLGLQKQTCNKVEKCYHSLTPGISVAPGHFWKRLLLKITSKF